MEEVREERTQSCAGEEEARSHEKRRVMSSRLQTGAIALVLLAFTLQASGQPEVEPSDVELASEAVLGEQPREEARNASKLKPVNFTLVDEIFAASLDEKEVVRRWRRMDVQLQDGMKAILKMIFPAIVSISQDARVSGDCSGGILKWILSLRNLRSWAIKMLDATGKPNAGMFEGSLSLLGNYRQCLNVRAPDEDEIEVTDQFEEYFRGQFCVLHLKPWMPAKKPFYQMNTTVEPLLRRNYKYYEKTLYDELAELAIAFNFLEIRADLCVPSTCTLADIQRVAELLSGKLEMRAKVMRCDIAPRESGALHALDATTCAWLAGPLALVALVASAGLLCALGFTPAKEGPLASLLSCLSPLAALRDWLESESEVEEGATSDERPASSRKPLALYGLRNLFVLWFMVVQMTMELKYQFLRESLALRDMLVAYWPFQVLINSTLLFDSLILTTAFTLGYTRLEASLRDLIDFALDRYARLVGCIVALVALTAATPLLAIQSPVWNNFVEQQAQVCKTNGYINLFFLQNFIAYDNICLPHTWLFCVELQLTLLCLPLVLLLKRAFRRAEDATILAQPEACEHLTVTCILLRSLKDLLKTKAGAVSCLLLLTGALLNFALVYANELPPSWFYTFPDIAQKNHYFTLYLTKTWTHLSVFIVGLLAGHLCCSAIRLRSIKLLKWQQRLTHERSNSPDLSRGTSVQSLRSSSTVELGAQQASLTANLKGDSNRLARSTPAVALTSLLAILLATFTWSTGELPSPLVAALYDALSRLIWSLALVSLMVQLCFTDTHSPSPLKKTLGHPIAVGLGKLSFIAYLISPYVNALVLGAQEQALFPSLLIVFHLIVGNLVITYTFSFILALMLEQPLRRLVARLLLARQSCKQKINISTYYMSTSTSLSAHSGPKAET